MYLFFKLAQGMKQPHTRNTNFPGEKLDSEQRAQPRGGWAAGRRSPFAQSTSPAPRLPWASVYTQVRAVPTRNSAEVAELLFRLLSLPTSAMWRRLRRNIYYLFHVMHTSDTGHFRVCHHARRPRGETKALPVERGRDDSGRSEPHWPGWVTTAAWRAERRVFSGRFTLSVFPPLRPSQMNTIWPQGFTTI